MKNFHLDAQIGGIEDVLAQGEVSDHRSAAFCSFRVCIRGVGHVLLKRIVPDRCGCIDDN